MRASDFFTLPSLKTITEEGEKRVSVQRKSEAQWSSLCQTLSTVPTHSEAAIQTEIQMEKIRMDFESRGLIRQEKIEKKEYSSGVIKTLKPSFLLEASKRLKEVIEIINELEKEEDTQRNLLKQLMHREYFKRKGDTLYAHVLDKIFIPVSVISQYVPQSYIQCTIFSKTIKYLGYISEPEIPACAETDAEALVLSIRSLRDRASNTSILGDYMHMNIHAKIERVDSIPNSQSKYAIYIICALKLSTSFERAIESLKQKSKNFSCR